MLIGIWEKHLLPGQGRRKKWCHLWCWQHAGDRGRWSLFPTILATLRSQPVGDMDHSADGLGEGLRGVFRKALRNRTP